MIVFNDNGAWSWFQDERAIVDPVTDSLLVASVANKAGIGGGGRDGNVEVAVYALRTGATHVATLHERFEGDDHNTPALLIRPDGRYLAMYTKHNTDALTRWRISADPHDATRWSEEETFDWSEADDPVATDRLTYSNLHRLSAEKRIYNFARAANRDPSFIVSADEGGTWCYGGKLLTQDQVGYVNGYVKYASNDIDRIDFLTTEHHPRDFNTGIYHGYVKGGKIHRSDGTVVGENIFGGPAPRANDLTTVFAAGTVVDGAPMTHCWTTDLAIDPAGHPYGIFTCRANDVPDNSNFEDHRFFYARFDGSTWRVHHLAKGDARLWESEEDYIGGAAVDPQDPDIVFISTPIDPHDDAALAKHEIFKGVTRDGGASWTWTPVTRNSSVSNLRPIVPRWQSDRIALLWFRGTMRRSQDYSTQIVGIIAPR